MKRWSLRAELRLWSALLVAAVLLVVAGGTFIFLQRQEVAELDQQLQLIGHHFLTVYEKSGAKPDWITPANVENTISETSGNGWFIEITDAAGKPLYGSNGLAGHSLAGGPVGMSNAYIGDNDVRLAAFHADGLKVCIAADLDELHELSSDLFMAIGLVAPAILGIIFFGSRWLAARALAPVAEIILAAERVSAQNPAGRLPVPATGDELARLATVLNATLDRLGAAFSQASRFSADASHEFKTPVAIARSGLERMMESPALTNAERETIEEVLGQLRRITRITQTLFILSRADAGQLGLRPADGDLAHLVRDCAEDAQVAADPRHITLALEVPATARACFDAERTTLVLQNLFENAVKYNHDGGSIKVSLTTRDGVHSVSIANTGQRISRENESRLFERFFRATGSGEVAGHGLGLSLARELARAQGGDVVLDTSGNDWTKFVFTVPAAGHLGTL